MNIYTVRQATQGLAKLYHFPERTGQRSCNRIRFPYHVTGVCQRGSSLPECKQGLRLIVLNPCVRHRNCHFSVRELGCIAGIVITASHNPREYNGYKVYWEDGAQITPPHDKNILAEVAKVTDFSQVKTMMKSEAEAAGLYHTIGKKMDDRYMEELKNSRSTRKSSKRWQKISRSFTLRYMEQEISPVRRVLKELGFENVYVVKRAGTSGWKFPDCFLSESRVAKGI